MNNDRRWLQLLGLLVSIIRFHFGCLWTPADKPAPRCGSPFRIKKSDSTRPRLRIRRDFDAKLPWFLERCPFQSRLFAPDGSRPIRKGPASLHVDRCPDRPTNRIQAGDLGSIIGQYSIDNADMDERCQDGKCESRKLHATTSTRGWELDRLPNGLDDRSVCSKPCPDRFPSSGRWSTQSSLATRLVRRPSGLVDPSHQRLGHLGYHRQRIKSTWHLPSGLSLALFDQAVY